MPLFTPEELEELRRADQEIEENFRITQEEINQSRKRDRESDLESLDHHQRKIAAYQAAYREANREKIAAYHAAYREVNREKIAAQKAAYRKANREKYNAYHREYQRKWREKQKKAASGSTSSVSGKGDI